MNRINRVGRGSPTPDRKRHQVDAGQTTFRISKSSTCNVRANNWVEKSVKEMDDAERGIKKRWKNRTRPQIVPRFTAHGVSRWANHPAFPRMIVAYRPRFPLLNACGR